MLPFVTNWELSAARALTVVHYLQDDAKIDPTRLAAVAFGQYRPVEQGQGEEPPDRDRAVSARDARAEVTAADLSAADARRIALAAQGLAGAAARGWPTTPRCARCSSGSARSSSTR